ncbi:MAG: hypothetical protein KC547_14335 [Anaerolineae bacterium]|nr:hypothetical protein [Anaerolineae bacterium]
MHLDTNITFQELVDGNLQANRLAHEANDPTYVTIVHFEPGVTTPFDLLNIKNLALDLDGFAGAVTIGAPMVTQILGRMLHRLTSVSMSEAKTVDEAQVLARRILAGEPVY